METTFGIDFGTTNTALSINVGGKVQVLNVDPYNLQSSVIRTVLYFNEEGEVFFGQKAINEYIEDEAAGRFMQSIKSFLSSKTLESTYIFGRSYTIEDLVAIMFRRIKDVGEKYVGHSVENVILGRPVIFSEDKERDTLAQERLESAAKKAGFKNVQFQFEPVAAALAFEETLIKGEERNVLIGDFGGGTSDFTIMKLHGGTCVNLERRGDVLSIGGVYIGGDAFDSQVMWEKITKYFGRNVKYQAMGKDDWLDMPPNIIHTLCNWHLIPQLRTRKTRELIHRIKYSADDKKAVENLENIITDNYGFVLFQAIEKAKCELSSLESSHILFKDRDLVINEIITKGDFENINKENVSKIAKCVDDVISESGLTHEQVDVAFITGGTSHIPCIQKIFIDRLGKAKMQHMDAFTSVVHGLGTSANFLF